MLERIRYAWGSSSLGDFLAAVSDRGLVAFEFMDRGADPVDALHERFAFAAVEDDPAGLAPLLTALASVVDHPAKDPGIVLDPRGTGYQKQVWSLLREIPAGTTTTYGAIAGKVGSRDAREVTAAIAANAIAILIPCHRVVKSDGSISGYRWGFKRKRALLEREHRAALLLSA